jgi:serine/threonine protein kinase/WD40 repeat protein
MSSETPNAETLFVQAIEIESAAERAAYLDRACANDPALRLELEQLVADHFRAGTFLENPAAQIADTLDEPSTERPGAIIGPYKLLEQIGEGGFGIVFLAEQSQPVRRKVALKILKAGMDTRQVVARFEAERQALAILDHPHIAKVFDGGSTPSGRPYFVMELVRGVPITQFCDEHKLSPRQRLELFLPICHAVQHAHQKGIIHRDLKPSNVLVSRHDTTPMVKVIDFGVAKALGEQLTDKTLFTGIAQMIGTPLYMSPEQAGMSDLDVDTRSDIYSLGVLLYELLTGTTPFTQERFKKAAYDEIRRIIREEDPPKPSTRLSTAEGLPSIAANRGTEPKKLSVLLRGELDWIVLKALEKDRNRRYDTANGLAHDIERYLHDEPVQACPPSAGYRIRKFARRNKRLLASVSLLALALMTGTVVSAWQAIRATDAEGLAQTRLRAETEAQEKAMRRLFDSRLAEAKAGSLSRRVGQRLDSLDVLAEATAIARDLKLSEEHFLQLRNAAIACLALPDLRLAKQWPGWPVGSHTVEFDGNLERYARTDQKGNVSVRRVAGDLEIASLPGVGSESWPHFSPDGRFLAVWSAGELKLWKLTVPTPVLTEQLPAADYLDFSSDSRHLVVGRHDGSIRLYDLYSGEPPHELPKGRPAQNLAFHPEGNAIAVLCDHSVEVRDVTTGKVIADLRHPVKTADQLAWHPDGKTLAVVCADRRIYLWDVPAGKQTVILEGMRNSGIKIAFNHAGNLIAATGWEARLRLWDSQTGQQVFSTDSGGSAPRFSRDDRWMSSDARGDKLGLWQITGGDEYRTLIHPQATAEVAYLNATIHGDRRLLAVGMKGAFALSDLASGRELDFVKLPGSNHVLFEPSGALLSNGPAGLLRWPLNAEPESGLVRLGPPRTLSVPGSICDIACSGDGRVIASAQFQGGLVLHADRPDQPLRLGPHDDVRYIAVSPDGLWVATGSHSRWDTKIWDALSGKLVKELPIDGGRVGFSPDSKWLATAGRLPRLWEVGTWREGPSISEGNTGIVSFAFSSDCKLLALETGYGVVRLLAPDTFKECARLEDPHQDRARDLLFSPDGTQLVTVTSDSESVHVWDLRAIREQLAKMGLDWDLPAYPPRRPDDAKSLRVQMVLGELGTRIQAQACGQEGAAYVSSSQWDKAIGAYDKAIALDPKSAKPHNSLAWLLATCPDSRIRDSKRAVELAKKAIELASREGNHWNTLGVAHYRAGDWKPAIAALEKSNELLKGKELSSNAFFLAMAHWQLGNKDEARKWCDQALGWMVKNKSQDEELRRFRAEAEGLLKADKKPKPERDASPSRPAPGKN